MGSTIAKVGMKPPHPGAFIREEILEPHGLNVSTGADVPGVRRATLSDLVNEKTSLSPEMGLRIEKAFGVNMDTLLQMQAWHDARTMRDRGNEIRSSDTRRPRSETLAMVAVASRQACQARGSCLTGHST